MKLNWPYKKLYERSHRRLIAESRKVSVLEDEVLRLKQMVYDVIPEVSDEPLYRRISNQRRELRALGATADMYYKWWQKELHKV